MKLLSIGASSSSTSINQQLADFAASQIPEAEITSFKLHGLDLPIYSEDEEKANGIPNEAKQFIHVIEEHDGIVLSLAEHNGSYTAAFKNLYDWASRIEPKVWQEKPMLLLSSSPGGRGGATVIQLAAETFSRMGANITSTFSLPHFYDHFSENRVNDPELANCLSEAVMTFGLVFKHQYNI